MKQKPSASQDAAAIMEQAIRALGNFAHVTVRSQRGHLNIFVDEDSMAAVARLTPIGADTYGLSFHSHTGKWEPMPFAGTLSDLAETVVTVLSAHLERWEFTPGMNRSDH
jgi:hypothetical protein